MASMETSAPFNPSFSASFANRTGIAVSSLVLPATASWPSTSRAEVAKAETRAALPSVLAIVAAARGLAVEGDKVRALRPGLAHPGGESRREQRRVDLVHQQRQPAPARNAVMIGQIAAQKPEMRRSPRGNRFIVVAVGDRAANDEKQYLRQRMSHPPMVAGVLDPAEMIQKRPKARLTPNLTRNKAHGGPPRESVRPTESCNPQSVNRP